MIETGGRQPSLPVLLRLLAAADLDLRLHLAPYDDHDDGQGPGQAVIGRAVIRTDRPAGDASVHPAAGADRVHADTESPVPPARL